MIFLIYSLKKVLFQKSFPHLKKLIKEIHHDSLKKFIISKKVVYLIKNYTENT